MATNFNIEFKRTFLHKPWVDTVDRVAAGGDNGFNARFQALEADLDTLTARFAEVNAALNSLAQGLQAEQRISVNPIFLPVGTAATWAYANGESKKGTNSSVRGIIPLALPTKGSISTLRVFGSTTGTGKVDLELYRKPLTGAGAELVVQMLGQKASAPETKFEAVGLGSTLNRHLIEPARFSYYFDATASGPDSSNDVIISGIQILCVP